MKKNSFYIVLASVLAILILAHGAAFAETHIYIDQAKGTNSGTTTGEADDPFKSVTYAFMKNKDTPDPWVVHIKAGIYDSNPEKPAAEKEVFPIELRQGITVQGDDGAEECILSGAFNPNSKSAIMRGENIAGITIKNLTLKDMNRTSGNGAACELIKCSGNMQGCVVSNNKSNAVWLSVADNGTFNFANNTFTGNSGGYGGGFYVSGAFTGDISGNTFTGNSGGHGGGFSVEGAFTGDISGNTFTGNSSRGFYVSGAFTGDISGNTFTGNSGYGGFQVSGAFTGDISANTFTGNSGGFYVSGKVAGNISANLFSRNSASPGGGFYLGYNDKNADNAFISNNFFLYNTTSYKLQGTGFYSRQNVTVVNNTFYGSKTDESVVNITQNAPNSVFKNNIFANLHTAIWEETELELVIENNDFSDVTDIMFRNNQPMGNDADFIALLLSDFQNNYTWTPGIGGEDIDTGNWTTKCIYDAVNNYTVLTDTGKNWTSGKFKGMFLKLLPSAASVNQEHPILDNTATQIMVRGNLTYTGLGNPDSATEHDYAVSDYHLTGYSQNIDAGTTVPLSTDYEGTARPAGSGFDIGADEYSSGGTPNKIPVADARSVTVEQNKSKTITLTGTDGDNDPLTYKVITQPSHGTLTGTAPNLTYTPVGDYSGSDSFTFRVNDGKADSQSATVSITVSSNPNKIPVANAQSVTTDEDTEKAITLTATDGDNDPLTYKVVTQPANGELTGTAPNLTYTPAGDYSGSDSFTFRVNDGKADSETATVNITVTPVNDVPKISYKTSSLLAVRLSGTDADEDPLTYAVVSEPVHGKLTGTAPNLVYTPDADYAGEDSFTVKANDGKADSQIITVYAAGNVTPAIPEDSDGDGVIDQWDTCPDTPAGSLVDKNGCSRYIDVTVETEPGKKSGWIKISGELKNEDEIPLCAMVLANGQYMFSCEDVGKYALEVPLDENREVTLFVFCDGMQPFKKVFGPTLTTSATYRIVR